MDAIVCRPGEGEVLFDEPRRTLRVLVDRAELTLTWFRYGPGEQGPDPHVHRRHSDAFYILEGELEVGLGPGAAETVRARAGTFAAAPPELVHTFRNASDGTAIFLNVHAPSMGFGDMLRARRDGREEDLLVSTSSSRRPTAVARSPTRSSRRPTKPTGSPAATASS